MHFNLLAPLLGSSFLMPQQRTVSLTKDVFLERKAHTTAVNLPGIHRERKPWLPSPIPDLPDPKIETPTETKTNEEPYIAHAAPKSTYLILHSPAVTSFVLVKDWSKDSLESLTNAVHTVVEKNPVLSGRATCAENWWKDPTIRIHKGEFLPPEHSFVTTIDKTAPSDLPMLPEDGDTKNMLAFIDKNMVPLVGKTDSTLQQIQAKSPLFEVKVVLLPNNYACIFTKMSHCLGDFVTYYELLDQISAVDKGEVIRPINWDNPLKATHEIIPEELSQRDLERLYGLPFIVGLASHLPTLPFRKQQYMLLSEAKIKEKKHQLKEEKGCKGLTSNSIVTAALCDACRSTDVFALTKSMRGITPGLGLRDGGNLHCEIPFQRCAGRNPLVIQDIVEKGQYFEPDEVPFFSSVLGKVGRISNCVVPMHHMSFGGGCKPICYCPSKSFLDYTPLDCAVIFRVAKGQDAILHNFRQMKPSGLLKEILLTEGE